MDSTKSTTYDGASSTYSFAPLLVEDANPPKKKRNLVWSTQASRWWWRRRWDRQDWKKAGLAALQDLKAFRWLAFLGWLFLLGWIAGLVFLLVMLASNPTSFSVSKKSACQPDGSFNLFTKGYNMWDISGFFQITVAWGTLTFANAKLIDVVWDVVFGRGGQALLAWISWSVFSDYVAASIQGSPVTYETFRTIFLQETPTLYSTWCLARDFVRSHGLRSRVVMVYVVCVAVFILAFPTLGSAMSGYQTNSGAFVRGYGGELIKYSDFDFVAYVIHDGWRVNLTGDFAVTYAKSSYSSNTEQLVNDRYGSYLPGNYYSFCAALPTSYQDDEDLIKEWEDDNPENSRCSVQLGVSSYTKEYGFFGLEQKKSTFMNQTLDAPVLNISAFYIPEQYGDDLFGRNWTDPRTQQSPFLDKEALRLAYLKGNETYDLRYVKSNGSCQPVVEMGADLNDSVRETYQWGFSFVQLFVMMILLLLWTVGTTWVWLKASMTFNLRGLRRSDKPKGFKGVLELAAAIRRELPDSSPDELNRKELAKEINKKLRGGSIELRDAESPAMYGLARGFWGWLKGRIWWHASWMAAMLMGIFLHLYFLAIFPCLFVASIVGRTHSSRAILSLGFILIGTAIFVAIVTTAGV
ncbi:hypothetical protein CMUS01_09902 [Colletotrichum musicola]|uniref:Uncharacterized protein n=1 Tax=Colletotrichum musicola TaxID=2175873 RepID=A0A8H6NA92_9PEZI|nr:hypothetical protein CMUS01_09902 [Colletotrichum musicola]